MERVPAGASYLSQMRSCTVIRWFDLYPLRTVVCHVVCVIASVWGRVRVVCRGWFRIYSVRFVADVCFGMLCLWVLSDLRWL